MTALTFSYAGSKITFFLFSRLFFSALFGDVDFLFYICSAKIINAV